MDYLQSVGVKHVVVGFTQFMQVMVLYKTLGLTPGEFVGRFKVAVGHSQGISVAAAFSMLTDEASFYNVSKKTLALLMLIAPFTQRVCPAYQVVANSSEPCPMVSVKGASKHDVEDYLQSFNDRLASPSDHMFMAIANTQSNFVVVGKTASAAGFVNYLHAESAKPDEDQSRIPFNKRRPIITTSYLGITVPYHCMLLEDAIQPMCDIAYERGWVLDAADMNLQVRALDDGHDIRTESDLTRYLFESICIIQIDWLRVADAQDGLTHIVDFGPGGIAGVGNLAYRNIEGSGVPVICTGAAVSSPAHPYIGTTADLYKKRVGDIVTAPNWLADFGPKLVRTASDGRMHIDTRMQRVLGQPTVMIAGMTPTTANEAFVAAINCAGYHAEIAGGGMHTEESMVRKLKTLAEMAPPGQGITLNCIYINPKQWSFQFPALLRLRREGMPISGLCIGGGVPSFEVALDTIESLRSTGIRHMSFKPSNAAAIHNVLRIASASKDFPILLQWTGGRAGGHHSLEDFHQPLLETYGSIRACSNVVLVVGSGFGDADGTLPYLTGDWSVGYGRSPMPVDGIMLGSRVMVAKEAGTSPAAKELIVAAPGISDQLWTSTFDEGASGITAVVSEYGESNHMLVTRSTRLMSDLRAAIFSQPRDRHVSLLQEHKQDIIARLNSDFVRPWFGKKCDGQVVDLGEMTYAEVIVRMVELMYISHQKRWICASFFHHVFDFVNRFERRVQSTTTNLPVSGLLLQVDPVDYATAIARIFPEAEVLVIASEDIQFFMEMWKRRGQTPLPFILALDQDFPDLFLKYLGWQSEDLDSVIDHDPQRVTIQQSPVSAQFSTAVDEPVKDILDGIYHAHINALLERSYASNECLVPAVEYIGDDAPAEAVLPLSVRVVDMADRRVFYLPHNSSHLPEAGQWLEAISGQKKSWLRALLTSPMVVQGRRYMPNVVQRVMRPRASRTATVSLRDGAPQSLEIRTADTNALELLIRRGESARDVVCTVYHPTASNGVASLDLRFAYQPWQCTTLIHQDMTQMADAEYRLYFHIWSRATDSPSPSSGEVDPDACIVGDPFTVTERQIEEFCRNAGNRSAHYASRKDGGAMFMPMEFMVFAAGSGFLRFLFASVLRVGQLNIVHVHQKTRIMSGTKPLRAGDQISSSSTIDGVVNTTNGKHITIMTSIYCGGVRVAELESAFLSVGRFVDGSEAFRRVRGRRISVYLPNAHAAHCIACSGWFVYCDSVHTTQLDAGMQLEFVLDSDYRFKESGVYSSISTAGKVFAMLGDGRTKHIANVDFEWNSCTEDPVIELLERYQARPTACLFENGEHLLELPPSTASKPHIAVPGLSAEYARISGDMNPIHVNPYIADVAGLPGEIIHGLWTSAATRAFVEIYAAGSDQRRIRSFDVEFVGMVFPKDRLSVEIAHTGMDKGRMLISARTTNLANQVVLRCTAEIEQPRTAYLFTGQGSQAVGMGMDLYEQSRAARDVWDRADRHMLRMYGISLLHIVRSNPTQLAPRFNSQAGIEILDRYVRLKENALDQQIKMFPGLCYESECLEFSSSTGLLNSTAFTQPILAVYAMAAVADMQSAGVVQSSPVFAGHSLGEYAALASLGHGLLSVEEVIDIVFYRGLLMHSVVGRDETGFSGYGMVSVNPSHVGATFGVDQLHLVLDTICRHSPGLLEIANCNVQGQQYIVSGAHHQLAVMRMVLDKLTSDPGVASADSIQHAVSSVVVSTDYTYLASMPANLPDRMLKGRATTPLAGIDIPFHSSMLLPCVAPLRSVLQHHISPARVHVSALVGQYVPNLTGTPFAVTKDYLQQAFELTQSPALESELAKWDDAVLACPRHEQNMAHMLLVEMLAYQAAMPVQWIKTQQTVLFRKEICRVIEVGVAPVLCGMARKTLSGQTSAHVDDDVFYSQEIPAPSASAIPDSTADSVAIAANTSDTTAPVVSAYDQPPIASSTTVESAEFDDAPLKPIDVIAAVIAHKFKTPVKDFQPDMSIKAMTAGNSTLQNEIVGDLHKEFSGHVPNKAEELPFKELASLITSFKGELGKHTQALLTRLFRNKMPGGFSQASAREWLQSTYALGPHRQDGLLLLALANEPPSRLADNDSAKEWLTNAATQYAASAGISFTSARGASGGTQNNVPVCSSADFAQLQKGQTELMQRQIEVLAHYAGIDMQEGVRRAEGELTKYAAVQGKLDELRDELGDEFTEGVMPLFKTPMARFFDSPWNWVRQDAFEWIQQAISGADVTEQHSPARIHRIANGADSSLKELLYGFASVLHSDKNCPNIDSAQQLIQAFCISCDDAFSKLPTYIEHTAPLQPTTQVLIDGQVEYTEVRRVGEATFIQYSEHMRLPAQTTTPEMVHAAQLPLLHIKTQTNSAQWTYDQHYSTMYHNGLLKLCTDGLSFSGKSALVTGCGAGSIGAEVVRGLLMGGAKVLATTSSYSYSAIRSFEQMYQTYAAKGAQLVVVPFNQGSAQDVKRLIDYVFDSPSDGKNDVLGWDIDYIVPFAACSDNGTLATDIRSRTELAQRVILTNVVRLIGGIKAKKEKLGLAFSSSLVVLPLSPNHGTFGGDGLYGECKLGLESLLNRWKSEHWQGYISLVGTVIGWTRGTGLMSSNNVYAQGIEDLGIRTFSSREMAFNVLGLLNLQIHRACSAQPIWADFTANLRGIKDLGAAVAQIQSRIDQKAEKHRAVVSLLSRQNSILYPKLALAQKHFPEMSPLARHRLHIPKPKRYIDLQSLHHLQDMVNLEKTVVVTGYGEFGPFGNAETRWEIEAFDDLTVEGCIELAWVMGLIKHFNGVHPSSGSTYIGWVDCQSGEPVKDADVRSRYLDYILAHTGIRLTEPDLVGGYDPHSKTALREVQIQHDLQPFEASAEDAAMFKRSNGDKVDIWPNSNGASWSVRMLKGCLIRVPVAVDVDRLVAGLIPTGWSAARYGIPSDVVDKVDDTTLYMLIAVVEALLNSGITDPYELYKYFHVSEVGNSIGSGLGGSKAINKVTKLRNIEADMKVDILQETFIPTIQAWVNMLLMSSAGPVKTVSGACATGILSVDVAVETIQSGKAKVMLAGGVDDITEESMYEFASMGASNNTMNDLAHGRTPKEASRPCTSTRGGFVESYGAGAVVLMSAAAAIKCGAPIYGIVAMSRMATDKQGSSVPAPGKGILTVVQEVNGHSKSSSPVPRSLDIGYRRRMIERYMVALEEWKQQETEALDPSDEKRIQILEQIEHEYLRQKASIQDTWGNEFWKNNVEIAPMRGSLAVWGLSVDDIGIASFHGTSTVANDRNESSILNSQFSHLGRTVGHAVPVVCQKWLTGHSKGAAAMFMINGVLQSMRTGIVPGNRNADNIDAEFKSHGYALYLSRSIQTTGIKAAMLSSFGFGQVGGEMLVVHPDYVLATLQREQLEEYNKKLALRDLKATRYWQEALIGNHTFVQVKSKPPFSPDQEEQVYLNPTARAHSSRYSKDISF
ncbi:fatty acid synthase alpha subunit Lsd1 [Coemansia sp. RSA 1933]|nr:fatty acid synthase alpha subunit Lsd1 [Coemansia sp. RSA 1933]